MLPFRGGGGGDKADRVLFLNIFQSLPALKRIPPFRNLKGWQKKKQVFLLCNRGKRVGSEFFARLGRAERCRGSFNHGARGGGGGG